MKYFVILLLIAMCANAQDLITDRPDYTESAVVVPAKMIQIESGAQYAEVNAVNELSKPNVLVRIGTGYNFEVRLGFPGWTRIEVSDQSERYLDDLLLEAKYQLTTDNAVLPVAAMLVATLPTGDEEVSVASTEVGVKIAAAYDVNDRYGLGINLGAISVDAGDEREIMTLASLSLGIGVTNRLGAFIETFAEMPQNESWQPVVDGGLTWLLTPVMQLDVYLGKGLNDQAVDLMVGGGLTFRFDTL